MVIQLTPCKSKAIGDEGKRSDRGLRALRDVDAILGMQIVPIPEMPTRRALALLTEDGSLALGVTAESAQELSDLLAKAAAEMRRAS
jgi:hypothetical protein